VTQNPFLLWLISGDSALARMAPQVGIGRILVDLERLGKAERQRHRSLFLSDHDWRDIEALRTALPAGSLFVRLDPLHEYSAIQVDKAMAMGVDGVMLPYFRDAQTVFRFVDLVAGRATLTPLVETVGAVRDLPALLASGAVNEFHVGLNDLALDMKLPSLQQLWGHSMLDGIAMVAREAGIPFGVGGVTDPRLADLPIDPAFVIAEQRRLNSSRALLGRTFRLSFGDAPDEAEVRAATGAIHRAYARAAERALLSQSALQPAP